MSAINTDRAEELVRDIMDCLIQADILEQQGLDSTDALADAYDALQRFEVFLTDLG